MSSSQVVIVSFYHVSADLTLFTGASGGIGLETVKLFCSKSFLQKD